MHTLPNEVDYTMLSTFLQCRRKYYYRIVRNLIGHKPPTAAEFGRCIHEALDDWYTSKSNTKSIDIFLSSFVEDPEDDKRTLAHGKKMLTNYFSRYEGAPIKILASEQSFHLPLGDINYMGRIDKIIDWEGAIYVMDHKTTSRLGYTFFYKIKPNSQFDGYIWAARLLGYPTCSGVVLDAISTAKTAPETLARDISTRSEAELAEWKWNTIKVMDDLQTAYEHNLWYPSTDRCCDYVECPYRKICKEEPDIREQVIQQEYKTEKWDPRERTGNAEAKPQGTTVS